MDTNVLVCKTWVNIKQGQNCLVAWDLLPYIGQLKWGLIFTNFVACVKFIHTLFWINSRIFDLVKITQYNMVCFEKSILACTWCSFYQ